MAGDATPSFDQVVLHRVSLPLAHANGATLDVFLDAQGAIRVVEDGDAYNRPTGGAASRTEVLRAVRRYLEQIGVDPTSGTLHIAFGDVGGPWYVTFDRAIAGYPVANAPMWWWMSGDKAYLELRADASLVNLYAIRPEHLPVPIILDRNVLDVRLSKVAESPSEQVTTFERALLWIRAVDLETGAMAAELSLGYCQTERWDYGWQAWCIDAATGDLIARGGGVD